MSTWCGMRRPAPAGMLVSEPTTYPRLTAFVLHVADADRERYVLEMAQWRDEQEGLARGRKRGAG